MESKESLWERQNGQNERGDAMLEVRSEKERERKKVKPRVKWAKEYREENFLEAGNGKAHIFP